MRKTVTPAAIAAMVLSTGVVMAADPQLTCEASKLGTTAKYAQCRLKADAKAVKTGDPVDYSKCNLLKFDDAETKATDAGGSCSTTGDQTTVADYLDDCTSRVATWLGTGNSGLPACGDNWVDHGEVCDGTKLNGSTCATTTPSTPYGMLSCNGSCDGFDTSGCKARFTDNGDGTITDNNTGLMWEKKTGTVSVGTLCPGGPTCADPHDVDNGYTWTAGTTTPNGTAFTDFLDKLNGQAGGGTGFGGHYDWRLPTREELQGIVDPDAPGCGSGSPCIDAVFGPTQSYHYWSSTTFQNNTSLAWYVSFNDGYASANSKTYDFFVRAVRTGS